MFLSKRFLFCAVAALWVSAHSHASSPAPYPVTVDSQRDTVSAITVFQANGYKVRATFTSGNTPDVITSENPFLWVYTNGVTNAVSVTGAWTVVNSASGLVDFVFSSASLNISTGIFPYQIGLDSVGGPTVYKQGNFQVKGSGASVGADVAFAANPVNWGLITWTGLPDWIEDAPGTNGIFARQSNAWKNVESDLLAIYSISNGLDGRITTLETGKASLVTFAATNSGLQAQIDTKLPTATHASSTASLWSAVGAIVSADNALTNVVASGRLSSSKTGALAYISFDATGLATNGQWSADIANMATNDQWAGDVATAISTLATVSALSSSGAAHNARIDALPTFASLTSSGAAHNARMDTLATIAALSSSGSAHNARMDTLSTIAALSSSGAAHNARMDTFIASATASNSFYLASNPSNYQSGAQVATNIAAQIVSNGFITGAAATTAFVNASGDTMSGNLVMGGNDITGVGQLTLSDGAWIQSDSATTAQFVGTFVFNTQPTIPGYATTGALATATANMATSGQWNASVAGSSNLAFAIGVGATNGINGVGLVATNLHLAQGVQVTNAQVTASNALARSGGSMTGNINLGSNSVVGVQQLRFASNDTYMAAGGGDLNAIVTSNGIPNWIDGNGDRRTIITDNRLASYSVTNTPNWATITSGTNVNNGNFGVQNVKYLGFVDIPIETGQVVPAGSITMNNSVPVFKTFGSSTQAIYGAWNFSPSSYVTASEVTNYARIFVGSVTQGQTGQFRDIYRADSGTSVWINVGGSTNWLRMNGVLNAF